MGGAGGSKEKRYKLQLNYDTKKLKKGVKAEIQGRKLDTGAEGKAVCRIAVSHVAIYYVAILCSYLHGLLSLFS